MVTNWLKDNLKGDHQIWTIVATLSMISIIVVASASGKLAVMVNGGGIFYHIIKHIILVSLGLGSMWFFHRLDYHRFAMYSNAGVILSFVLLIYAYKFEQGINHANRWIHVGGLTFMPSDLAKLSLITNLAAMLAKRQHVNYTFKEILPMIIKIILVCSAIALTNVSTSLLLFTTCFLLMFFGRVPSQYLLMALVGIFITATLLVMTGTGSRIETARNRVINFASNWNGSKRKDASQTTDYQIERSFYAIANGGIVGKGPGKSQQRYFLTESESDFIYAIIIEEWGMIGGVIVLGLYLWFLYRGMKAVDSSGRAFGGLLSAGLTFSLVIQAMVHMGVATGLGPVTGQNLPLLSMGGSSLLFTGAMVGIIIAVSRDKVKNPIL
ncbi:FtsW/RodA/SpoVE family cell cycle protein [Arcicella aquatica]|uniref:Probable peptidoglycan glycosyltransferase FtsW n=1 Tax=Arcicella aquatica TaxID=217141 RepID=A0ABU5QLW5_9BACT|nr:FtsW/RodA/SpoVE family cell cycle protein [Arcicella aquatica]MEA5258056.1 FtsW/RodA/SpoVE family cell cycle protein [Arcicella aquatica]